MYILNNWSGEMKTNKSYPYRVVDVFTTEPLEGNPLAVFPSATGLSANLMQKIARELNLSETVFVLPATHSDYAAKVRIFTPGKELDFAGHPTVGTAYILLSDGKVPKSATRFIIEENVGPVSISVEQGTSTGPSPKIWLKSPSIREGSVVDKKIAAELLGLTSGELLDLVPQVLDAGNNPTLFIPLVSKESVDQVSFDTAAWARFKLDHPTPMCVFVFAATPDGAYSRMFAPDYGIPEDPATGSSTGPLASYMMRHGLVSTESGTTFCSEQGTRMGRRSILHVRIDGTYGADGIAIGGYVTPLIEATISL
jgi:trans-2,3-dihydro-3-hydroxyanthranilate isomerase